VGSLASGASLASLASSGDSSEASSLQDSSEGLARLDRQLSSSCSSLELEDIQEAIEGVRRTILQTEERTEARKELVHRLIRLRIRREDLEHRQYFLQPGQVQSLGHSLVPAEPGLAAARPAYCQECCGAAWPLLQAVYTCTTCSHTVHAACLPALRRACVGAFTTLVAGEQLGGHYDGSVSLSICPELSLAEQEYRCGECHSSLTPPGQARVCDYTGLSYCCSCHWGGLSPSPARILANWDFTPRPMAEASLQYLALVARRPSLRLSRGLQAVTEQVSGVVAMRHQLVAMKKYLVVCRLAQEEKILTKLKERQHFVEGPEMYSLQDLVDLESGQLASYLAATLAAFQEHIRACVLCTAKGFVCEVCTSTDLLFPFTPVVETCSSCQAVYHRDCFRSVAACPRCARRGRKVVEE